MAAHRDCLHQEISNLLSECEVEGLHEEVLKDPSLLADRIDTRFLCRVDRAKTFAATGTTTTTTWASVFAAKQMAALVRLGLAAGLHPDDPEVFIGGPLIAFEGWHNDPERLALALQHGANPDTKLKVHNWERESFTVGQMLVNKIKKSGISMANREIECLLLVLRAGAKVLGPKPEVVGVANPSAAWLIASSAVGVSVRQEEILRQLSECIQLMGAAGMDIDTKCGNPYTPPIIEAARAKNRPLVEGFIAAGADVSDAHITRPKFEGRPPVGTLLDEADAAFGAGARSWVLEAMMRSRMPSMAPTVATAAPRPARRAKVL